MSTCPEQSYEVGENNQLYTVRNNTDLKLPTTKVPPFHHKMTAHSSLLEHLRTVVSLCMDVFSL